MAYTPTLIDFEGSDADNLPSAGSKINTNLADIQDGIQDSVDERSWQDPVKDKDLILPPGGASEGDRYIVGPASTGAWLNHDDEIAEYRGTSWVFFVPVEGWRVWIDDEDQDYNYTGSAWALYGGGGGAHASSHEDGGADELDGDTIVITWTGHTNYTPGTAPAEVDSTDDLTAHLYGIDQAIGGGGTHDIDGASHTATGLTTDHILQATGATTFAFQEFDGDHLDVDWNPSNYTPSTTPTEASDIDDLTAHLYGIDQELGTVATLSDLEPGVVSSSTSGQAGTGTDASRDDHSHDLGSHNHSGAAQGGTIAHSATTGRTVDDHHNQSHVLDGGDHTVSGLTTEHALLATGATTFAFSEIDGDHLDIDWNPSYYTPATTPTEADDVDDLTAHLYGVDQALNGKASTDHDASHIDGGSDAIDGDQIEITWTGYANYTPATTPSEVTQTDQLTAHLYGIDQAIGGGGTHDIDGASHTAAGLTTDHVIQATGATTFAFQEFDGDQLDIDWSPSNYTPSVTPTEADDVDDLTAHLYGIDQELGSVPTLSDSEPGVVSSSTSGQAGTGTSASRDDHNHDLGTHAHTGATDGGTIAHSSTTGRTEDDHHNRAHVLASSDHTATGLTTEHALLATGATTFAWGEIDGDHLDIDWNPTNYTPASTPTEADDTDDLTAHLYGIDQELGSVATLSDTEPGVVSSSTSGAAGSGGAASREDHSHDLGTHAHTGATDGGTIAHSSTTGRTANDHHAQAHAADHAAGQADALDGDGIECSIVPVNYTPSASTIAGNFDGVDTAIGLLSDEYIEDLVGAMVGGSSVQTNISVSYDDTNGELDFEVENVHTVINVKDYGATGNGSTDDLTAIQNALNACDSTYGSTCYFPPGKYRISDTLVPTYQGTTLLGAGTPGSTLNGCAWIYTDAGVSAIELSVSGGTLHGATGYAVKNLYISSANGAGGGDGIYIDNVESCVLENVTCADFIAGSGVVIDGGSGNAICTNIYNLNIDDCLKGLYLTGTGPNSTRIYGGFFRGRVTDPRAGSIGIHVNTGDTFKAFGTAVEYFATGFYLVSSEVGSELHGHRSEACDIHIRIGASADNFQMFGGGAATGSLDGGVDTGIQIDSGAAGCVMMPTYLVCDTNISDNGTNTVWLGVYGDELHGPGGSDTYIQINDGGTLSGESNFTFDKSTEKVTLSGPGTIALTGRAYGNIATLTDAASITVDMSTGQNYIVTLGGDRAMANPSNAVAGQSGVFIIKQDVTGSRALTWGNQYYFPSDTAPTLTTAGSSIDIVPYFCESTSVIHCGAGLLDMGPTA